MPVERVKFSSSRALPPAGARWNGFVPGGLVEKILWQAGTKWFDRILWEEANGFLKSGLIEPVPPSCAQRRR